MIVVSDTSPLNYLVLVGQIEILRVIFSRVVVPPAVMEELRAPGSPEPVKAWAEAYPSWLEVQNPQSSPSDLALGKGERVAICLASELGAICLLDDRKARREAEQMGVRITGLLGVLAEARDRRLIDAQDVVRRLSQTSFRASPALISAILAPEQ